MGPAHQARITSSQSNIIQRGSYVIPYLLDVKTISGVVVEGTYQPVETIASLNLIVGEAFSTAQPLLLEVQTWRRQDLRNPRLPLIHAETAFHLLQPALTIAARPMPDEAPANRTAAVAESILAADRQIGAVRHDLESGHSL